MHLQVLILFFISACASSPKTWETYFVGTAVVIKTDGSQSPSFRVYSRTSFNPAKDEIININGRDTLGADQTTFEGRSVLRRIPGTNIFSEVADQNNMLIKGEFEMVGAEWQWKEYKAARTLANGERQEMRISHEGNARSEVLWYAPDGKLKYQVLAEYHEVTKKEFDEFMTELRRTRARK